MCMVWLGKTNPDQANNSDESEFDGLEHSPMQPDEVVGWDRHFMESCRRANGTPTST